MRLLHSVKQRAENGKILISLQQTSRFTSTLQVSIHTYTHFLTTPLTTLSLSLYLSSTYRSALSTLTLSLTRPLSLPCTGAHKNVVWKRPDEFAPDPQLFVAGMLYLRCACVVCVCVCVIYVVNVNVIPSQKQQTC